MKKLFALSFLILPFAVSAQFAKGNIFLGGTLSATSQKFDNSASTNQTSSTQTNNNFGIAPSVGFFLSEKIAIGAAISYASQQIDYTQSNGFDNKTRLNSIGINPYFRIYQPITNSIYFGLQGGISFARGNLKQTTTNGLAQTVTEIPNYSIAANFKPLFIFFPSSKWGVEASIGSLGYSYSRNLPDANSNTSFGLTAGTFSFGIAYYFIKK
jgi:hypothetical protein